MKAHLLVVLGLALGLVLLVFMVASGPVSWAQVTCQRYVSYEGNDGIGGPVNDCTDQGTPCRTVQHAIDRSVSGDRICVSSVLLKPDPTVYSETITIDRSVILDGAWESQCFTHKPCIFQPTNPCTADRVVLHAEGKGRVITIEPRTQPTIDCFTITGGDANTLGGDPDGNHAGGGIFSDGASPTIVHNIITGNFGCDVCTGFYGRGGGIYLLDAPSTALIGKNIIANNVADDSTWGKGGGIMLRDSDAVVELNEIRDNRAGLSAGYGGGITVEGGEPIIKGNDIHDNVAGQAVQGLGGGVFVWSKSTATIEGNAIYDNLAISGPGDPGMASRGGGIYYSGNPEVEAVIVDNQLGRNTASPVSHAGHGGGICASGLLTPSLIAGNTFDGNVAGALDSGWGGGIYLGDSEATVAGNDFLYNAATESGPQGKGGGIYVEGGQVTLRGNTLTRNAGGRDVASSIAYGGGLVLSDTVALVLDNLITGNRGTYSPEFAVGGGAYVFTSTVRIVGNTITQNSLTTGPIGFGGGLYLHYSTMTVDGNTITDNRSGTGPEGRGGGVRLAFCPDFGLTNNIIARNYAEDYASGVGVAVSSGSIAHNTIADNTGGDGSGVHVSSSSHATLYGNIILGHTVGITNTDWPASTVQAEYTLFEANLNDYGPGVTSLNELPGPALLRSDYHLSVGSGAIDQVPPLAWLTWDIDRDGRPLGASSDAGADEILVLHAYLPVILRVTP